MCGLCGVIAPAGRAGADDIQAMTRALLHRGPDDEGSWQTQSPRNRTQGDCAKWGVALGHTRLSILDLSRLGRQPMVSDDGRCAIAYNGEIYNHRSLRSELERQGVRFRSACDTEVVLQAYCAWGLDALPRFNGMFALALWDGYAERLVLARDRLGIKPLYYGLRDGVLTFGSELGALRAHSTFRPEIDPQGLRTYLRFGWLTGERTIYAGVRRVLPGNVVIWQGGKLSSQSFWRVTDHVPDGPVDGFEAAVDALDERLGAAVEARLISDVPLGAFLSGGVDSSVVVALMKERARGAVKTFAIGFEDRAFDEAPHARAVARYLNTEHTELRVGSAQAREVLHELPGLYDEPFADSSAIPTLLLSRMTREHVTVALSGDGGDELFGGYQRYGRLARLLPLMRLPRPLRRALWVAASPFASSSIHNGLAKLAAARDDADLAESFLSGFGDELAAAACPRSEERDDTFRSVFGAASGSSLRRTMYAEARTYLNDDVLVKVDRASMSVGLEVRVPILDHSIVEFAFRLHSEVLHHGGVSKAPLRAVLYRRVPRELIERRKHGFSFPVRSLLGAELEDWTRRYLSRDRIEDEGLFDPQGLLGIVERALARGSGGDSVLWRLLCFERWFAVMHRGETGE